jgi:protein gp37
MDDALALPGKVRKPTRWAIWNDLFHPKVENEFISEVYKMIYDNPQHTFLILTKQAKRMYEWYYRPDFAALSCTNLWLGITAENQTQWDIRSPYLNAIPAVLKWVSFEPLLGPINTGIIDWLDWAIVGGENSSKARPCHPEWISMLRYICIKSGAKFFFKQWGSWKPIVAIYEEHINDDGIIDGDYVDDKLEEYYDKEIIAFEYDGGIPIQDDNVYRQPDLTAWYMARVGKKAAGRELDGKIWNEMPVF